MMRRRHDLIAIAFLIAIVTIFFAREVFTDATLVTFRLVNLFPWLATATQKDLDQPSITSDSALSYYPRRVFATEMIRQGKMPFWNPYQFCGTPFFANFQSAVLYPVNLGIYWLSPQTQMDVFLWIHFLIAAVFGFLLARQLGLSRGAAIVVSASYTFCGFMVTRFGQPTLVSTASWLPAVIYFAERLIEAPSFRRAGGLAIVLSFCILAGFPQVVLFVVYSLIVYVLLRVGLARGQARRGVTLAFVGIAAATACFVCAFQLLPTYELSGFSYRRVLPYSMILSSAQHPLVALKYFVPDVLGDPLETSVISKALLRVEEGPKFAQNYVSTTGYVGILPIALSLLAFTKPNRKLLPFIVLAALSLLVVFGSPLLHLFYKILPGFNFSRVDRVVVVFMFSASLLAGYGFDRARAPGGRSALVACGAGLAVFAVALALWLRLSGLALILKEAGASSALPSYITYASGKLIWFVLLACASAAILILAGLKRLSPRVLFMAAIAVLLADLISNGVKFKVSQPAGQILPSNALVDSLSAEGGQWRIAKYRNDVVPANLPTLVGIDDVHGYDALNVRYYLEMLGALDSSLIDVSNAALRRRIGPITSEAALSSPLLDLLNAKYVLTTVRPSSVGRRQVTRLVNEDFLPRAFLVGRANFFPDYGRMLEYMKQDRFDPRSEVLLTGSAPGGAQTIASDLGPASADPGPGQEPGEARIVKYDATGPVIEVNARTGCYLVVSDTFYPGWLAVVDGKVAPLLRADYAFRAVSLEAGSHTVRMVYRSSYFRIGLLFTIAGIALIALMLSSRTAGATRSGGPN